MKDKRKQAEPAWISSNLKLGSIILAGPKGDVVLDWKEADQKKKGKQRMRGIPPGKYRLRTVRIEKVQGQVHWFTSATTAPRKAMPLRSNKKIKLEVDDTIHFTGKVRRAGKRTLTLNFGLQNKDHHGLSIYKAGKRVPMNYTVFSKEGSRTAWGKMNYG